jgi:hypothetical protein
MPAFRLFALLATGSRATDDLIPQFGNRRIATSNLKFPF